MNSCRDVKDNPCHNWQRVRQALLAQYADEGDSHFAGQRLRRLQQKSGETVQNFGERILNLAGEAYDNLDQPLVQSILVNVLIDGVRDDASAKRLTKAQPTTLRDALNMAINEQAVNKQFKMRLRTEEAMDVDSFGGPRRESSGTQTSHRVSKLEENLAEVVAQMGGMMSYMQKNMTISQNGKWGQTDWQRGKTKLDKDRHFKDGQPICFICSKVGHIAKHCRQRGSGAVGPSKQGN